MGEHDDEDRPELRWCHGGRELTALPERDGRESRAGAVFAEPPGFVGRVKTVPPSTIPVHGPWDSSWESWQVMNARARVR